MANDLAGLKAILDDLEQAIEEKKRIRNEQGTHTPDWAQRCWLHGATEITESNELGKYLFEAPAKTELAVTNAEDFIVDWREWLEEKGPMGAYYTDEDRFDIPEPKKNEPLFDFIVRLARLFEEGEICERLSLRALDSFLDFVRTKYPVSEVAFIEQVFPKKRDIVEGKIIRRIAPEVLPISQERACEILVKLARMCRYGSPTGELSAAESLGLCWMCLTASRLRLPIYLKTLWAIKVSAVHLDGDFPKLLVPTFFGEREIRISCRVAHFLQQLSSIPSPRPRETILQRPLRTLTRTFDTALKKQSSEPEDGNITYVSLLTPPHHFGRCRFRHK